MKKCSTFVLMAGLTAGVAVATPPTMTDMKFDSETKTTPIAVQISDLTAGAMSTTGNWTVPTAGGSATVVKGSDNYISVDSMSADELKYTQSGASVADDKATRVYVRFCDNSGTPTVIIPSNAQAALAISNDTSACHWMGLGRATASDGSAKWYELTGSVNPALNTWYDLRIEFDNQNRVRYSVKAATDSDYAVLSVKDGDECLYTAKSSATAVGGVAFAGFGKIGDFSEDSITANDVAQIGSTTYKSVYDAVTVAGASSGQTVKMLAGVTNSAALKFSAALANAPTIDLNGQVLSTSAENLSATIQSGYLVLSSGTVTLGNGCKVPSNGSPYGSCTVSSGYLLSAMAVADTYDGQSYGYVVLSSELAPSDDRPVYTAKDSSGKSIGNIVVAKSWITGKYPTATDAASQQDKLNETGSNGCKVWESYELGLDPTSATSKPIVTASALSGTASTALFGLDNVTVNAGATATFRVIAKNSDGTTVATSEETASGSTVSMDLPPSSGSDNLRTYTTVVTVKPAQ